MNERHFRSVLQAGEQSHTCLIFSGAVPSCQLMATEMASEGDGGAEEAKQVLVLCCHFAAEESA